MPINGYTTETTHDVKERMLRRANLATHIDLLTIDWNEPEFSEVGASTIFTVLSEVNPKDNAYHVCTPVMMWSTGDASKHYTMLYATYSMETGELIDTNCISADGELQYAPDFTARESEETKAYWKKHPDALRAYINELGQMLPNFEGIVS